MDVYGNMQTLHGICAQDVFLDMYPGLWEPIRGVQKNSIHGAFGDRVTKVSDYLSILLPSSRSVESTNISKLYPDVLHSLSPNDSPLKIGNPKRKGFIVFQPNPFSGVNSLDSFHGGYSSRKRNCLSF